MDDDVQAANPPPYELEEDVPDPIGPDNLRTFFIEELRTYTANFKREVKGGANPVYRGTTPEGYDVAIKSYANKDTPNEGDQWKAEVKYLTMFDSSNIIKLIGKCVTRSYLFLIYPWMPLGDVNSHIAGPSWNESLNWEKTLRILRGTAKALGELHSVELIYRDLKASNVLLTKDWDPVLADFGTVGDINRNIIGGTVGHVDPIAWEGKASKYTDVFSFGVLILQLIMKIKDREVHGKCPYEVIEVIGDTPDHIIGWAYMLLEAGMDVVHPHLKNSGCSPDEANWVVLLALKCMHASPHRRPTISVILDNLNSGPIDLPDQVLKKLNRLVVRRFKRFKRSQDVILDPEDSLNELPKAFQHIAIASSSSTVGSGEGMGIGSAEEGIGIGSAEEGIGNEEGIGIGSAEEIGGAEEIASEEGNENARRLQVAHEDRSTPIQPEGSTSVRQTQQTGGKWGFFWGCISCRNPPPSP